MTGMTSLMEVLEAVHTETPEVEGVALVSSDGRILEHAWRAGIEPDKIGAVGAALLGLGKKAIQILSNGEFLQVVLQSSGGMLAVYNAGERAVLIVSTNRDTNLGMLNLSCRQIAAECALLLEE